MYINGVNLGNWLVLEKWMSPSLFEGTTAYDEYWLPRQLPRDIYEARIRTHRDEYITERDFVTIKSWGVDAVRIPVPHFIFGDVEPFIGCVEHLDRAFTWAEKYGLKILIDLHTAPDGQNGFDNGGISGVFKWAQKPENIEFILDVLERLAKRYGNRDCLWGIEVLNEPVMEGGYFTAELISAMHPPLDPEVAKGSATIPRAVVEKFYLDAYNRLRALMPKEKYVVFQDAFMLSGWKEFFTTHPFENVALDTHQYLMIAEIFNCEPSIAGYKKFITEQFESEMVEMNKYVPVICGEWCVYNSLGTNIAKEEPDETGLRKRSEIYQAVSKAQLEAWKKCSGHFYWSYKILADTATDEASIGKDAWDLGRCVDFGWVDTADL